MMSWQGVGSGPDCGIPGVRPVKGLKPRGCSAGHFCARCGRCFARWPGAGLVVSRRVAPPGDTNRSVVPRRDPRPSMVAWTDRRYSVRL